MRNKKLAAVGSVALAGFAALAMPAGAADHLYQLTIANAMASPIAQRKLDNTVRYYFGDTKFPGHDESFGYYITNKKTNAVGRSDEVSCTRAFLSAMIELQTRAHQLGANAVINIHSYYKKKDVSSETQVECYSGLLMSGVALRAEFVKTSGK